MRGWRELLGSGLRIAISEKWTSLCVGASWRFANEKIEVPRLVSAAPLGRGGADKDRPVKTDLMNLSGGMGSSSIIAWEV